MYPGSMYSTRTVAGNAQNFIDLFVIFSPKTVRPNTETIQLMHDQTHAFYSPCSIGTAVDFKSAKYT